MNKRTSKLFISKKTKTIIIFRIIPTLIVISWLTFISPISPFDKIPEFRPKEPPLDDDFIEFKARKFKSGKEIVFKKRINLSETVLYTDMWRSHWCTYYNDREFFFTPHINELIQLFRARNVTSVHISLCIDGYLPHSQQRKRGLEAIKKGNLSVLEKYNAQQTRYHHLYIPGFKDVCMNPGQERFGPTRDNRLTKQIVIANEDVFVGNFKESAMSFVGLGAKTVIIMGQHTNMCLMAVMLYCSQVGLDLVIVRDLVDTAWVYENQKTTHPSHESGNVAVNHYFEKEFGVSVLSYDLQRAIKKSKRTLVQPHYSMFANRAHVFRYI